MTAWQAYQAVRDRWQNGGEFHRRFPQETQYRHSLPEEAEALTAEAVVLDKLAIGGDQAEVATNPDPLLTLTRLYHAGLIEAYVLVSPLDQGVARDYVTYRAANRDKLVEYIDTFVVPRMP